MGEDNKETNQSNQTGDFKQAARDEALSAAEKGLEAAREALAAAEKKLAEVQRNCQAAENMQTSSSQGAPQEKTQTQGDQNVGDQGAMPSRPDVTCQAATSSQSSAANQPGASAQASVEAEAQGTQAPQPGQTNAQASQPFQGQPNQQQADAQSQTNGQYQAAQNQGYQYQYQPVQPHYSAPYASQKDHVAAGLLAIFLGAFGVHKFYLGYNTQGFIMLAISILAGIFTIGLAAGVIWVIAIIEGVLYLTKTQSEFERIYVYGKREWF